jgi:hypothetical protein
VVYPKHWWLPATLDGIIFQKTAAAKCVYQVMLKQIAQMFMYQSYLLGIKHLLGVLEVVWLVS